MHAVRKSRLSTISSQQNEIDINASNQRQVDEIQNFSLPLSSRRRESSYTDALDDPLKFREIIARNLAQEDADLQ